jgi:hypothetical protein
MVPDVLEQGHPWDGHCDVWGHNALYDQYPLDTHYYDGWFQLHSPEYMAEHWANGWVEHKEWLAEEHPFPIYMQRHYKHYPSSVTFPRKEIMKYLPRGEYQTVTTSWCIAYAILRGYKRIELWGMNMGGGEPHAGRACVEYWLGVAEGKGIETWVATPTDLFTTVHKAVKVSRLQYAYDHEPAFDLGDGWRDVR